MSSGSIISMLVRPRSFLGLVEEVRHHRQITEDSSTVPDRLDTVADTEVATPEVAFTPPDIAVAEDTVAAVVTPEGIAVAEEHIAAAGATAADTVAEVVPAAVALRARAVHRALRQAVTLARGS